MELAVAAFCLHCLELVIASPATHEFTAIHAFGSLIAEPALRAQGAGALIAYTVVWAGINVHKVMDGWGVEAAVHLHQLAPGVEFHSCRAIVFLLQGIANFAEVRQL